VETEPKELAKYLAALTQSGQPWPKEVFFSVAEKFALTPIEAIVLRRNTSGKIEVLLMQRESDDPHWKDMYHTPGTIALEEDVMPDDELPEDFDPVKMYAKPLARLQEKEYGEKFDSVYYVGPVLHKVARGPESAQMFVCTIKGEPTKGKYFAVDELPDNIVPTQIKFIRFAAKFSEEHKII
jgi:hypothetical protein